jgi:hypothetical protein
MHMSDINAWLRSKGKIFLAVICVILMVVWFVPLDRLMDSSKVASGRIYGQTIDGKKVQRVARSLAMLQGQRQSDSKYDPIAEAWQALIFVEEAKRYGIEVGEEQLADVIRTQFGEHLTEFLKLRQMTRGELEEAVRILLTRNELIMAVSNNVTLPESEAWMWYSREFERVKADYLQIRVEALTPFVQLDEEGLRKFFERFKEYAPEPGKDNPEGYGYLVPERVKIEYILAPYESYKAAAQVTEKQVADYYEAHKEEFRLPDAKPADKKEEPKKDAAKPDEAKKEEPPKPQYKSLADVTAEITNRLKTEKAKKLAADAMADMNTEIGREIEVPFGVEQTKVADFAAAAKKANLTYKVTDFFTVPECEQILAGAPDIRQKAFGQGASSVKVPRGVYSARDGDYMFQIVDVQTPRPPAFDTVRARVELDFRKEEALNLAESIAAKAAKAANLAAATEIVDTELAKVVKPIGAAPAPDVKSLRVTGRSDFFGRPKNYAFMNAKVAFVNLGGAAGFSNLPYFAEKAFELRDNQVGVATEKGGAGMGAAMARVFLLQRAEVQPADRAAFAGARAQVAEEYLQEKRMAALQGWQAEVRRRADPSAEVRKCLKDLPDWGGEK